MFGGKHYYMSSADKTSDLWKLNTTREGCFVWSKINTKHASEEPSPRKEHSGWEYREKLYIYGGYGPSLRGYLSKHGDFKPNFTYGDYQEGYNNQLLCFDPSVEKWTNLKCSGSVPRPHSMHSTARIRENVWLFGAGGYTKSILAGLFELNMHTLLWTEIQNTSELPRFSLDSTLSVVSDNQLLLHAGLNKEFVVLSDTWILDLPSQTWREYSAYKKQQRYGHTCTTGINRGNCLIIGGSFTTDFLEDESELPNGYRTISHLMLEPLSLQQLASRVIYKHKSNLRFNNLPPKLMFLLELPENGRNSLRV